MSDSKDQYRAFLAWRKETARLLNLRAFSLGASYQGIDWIEAAFTAGVEYGRKLESDFFEQ
jgi:hypothetical protein